MGVSARDFVDPEAHGLFGPARPRSCGDGNTQGPRPLPTRGHESQGFRKDACSGRGSERAYLAAARPAR
jgi:hypothetical protein